MIPDKEQVLLVVEERIPEGDYTEEEIPITEDEVQIIPSPTLPRQFPVIVETLQDSMPHYNKLRMKGHHSSLVTPIKSEKNPFFEDLPNILRK